MTNKDTLDQIYAFIAQDYPNESCGVLINDGKRALAVRCENLAQDPRNFFILSATDYAAAADQGEVIAVWHSHVDIPPRPSEADIAGCNRSGLDWLIVAVKKHGAGFQFDGPTLLQPTGEQAPYIGRPYLYGIYDCWSLVQDYYLREYGIGLGDYPRVPEFWKKGLDFFGENFAKEGFTRLIDQPPAVGDLFLIQSGADMLNHIAIYVGDDMILHHCHGRLSRRDVYAGYWCKHTVHHLRHASKC